jgi:hypothetical protein
VVCTSGAIGFFALGTAVCVACLKVKGDSVKGIPQGEGDFTRVIDMGAEVEREG